MLVLFMSESVLLMFSCKKFIVSGLTYRTLIHFKFVFLCGVREYTNFILLYEDVQFFEHHLLKRLSFPTVYFCLLCHNLGNHRCVFPTDFST